MIEKNQYCGNTGPGSLVEFTHRYTNDVEYRGKVDKEYTESKRFWESYNKKKLADKRLTEMLKDVPVYKQFTIHAETLSNLYGEDLGNGKMRVNHIVLRDDILIGSCSYCGIIYCAGSHRACEHFLPKPKPRRIVLKT